MGFGFGGLKFNPTNQNYDEHCGKVIAEPKVTMWIGELSCLKAKM